MCTWKINMKNGDCYFVQSKVSNSFEFMKLIIGENALGINISYFELTKPINYEDNGVKFVSNWIAIVSTDVSSVEWLSK